MTAPISSRAQVTAPQTYKIAIGWRVFFTLLGAVVGTGGVAGSWYFGAGHEVHSVRAAITLTIVCFAFTALGLYVALWALRSRVFLSAVGIESKGVFRVDFLPNDDIAGWRIIQQQNAPSELVIVPREGRGKRMRLSRSFNFDANFHLWLNQFRNLDLQDESNSVEEMMTNPELGATVEQRSEKLVQARRVSRILTFVTFAAAAWAWFYPEPYSLAITTLIVIPLIALFMTLSSNGLYRLDKKKNDAHPDLAIPFIFPGLVLLGRTVSDFEFLHWGHAVVLSLVLGISLCAFATVCDPSLRGRFGMLAALLFCTCAYSLGAVFAINAELDHSAIQVYRTEITGKHVTHGKHTEYRLELSPWGPKADGTSVSVSRDYFDSVRAGDEVCTFLRNGALHIPWYTVGTCPTE